MNRSLKDMVFMSFMSHVSWFHGSSLFDSTPFQPEKERIAFAIRLSQVPTDYSLSPPLGWDCGHSGASLFLIQLICYIIALSGMFDSSCCVIIFSQLVASLHNRGLDARGRKKKGGGRVGLFRQCLSGKAAIVYRRFPAQATRP